MSKLKNNSSSFLIAGVIILVIVTAAALIMSLFQPTTILRIGNGVFDARIAYTQVAREKGLSGVDSLGPNQALILVFPSDGEWKIWMKDMKIPLDIVWLNKDKEVVYSVKDVSRDNPTIFAPNSPARYVVELPVGTIDGQNIKTGRTATFDIKQGEIK